VRLVTVNSWLFYMILMLWRTLDRGYDTLYFILCYSASVGFNIVLKKPIVYCLRLFNRYYLKYPNGYFSFSFSFYFPFLKYI
jgi:hypothetical protein